MENISVIGSINIDIIVSSKRLPQHGETVQADNFYLYPGGKGANQAVSASRLGTVPEFTGKIGKDYFSDIIMKYLSKENVKLDIKYGEKTGVAIINVESSGNNMITVYSGANSFLFYDDINTDRIKNSIVLFQQEIPLETIKNVIHSIKKNNNIIITDPTPFNPDNYILENSDIITPNETEASLLASMEIKDIDDAKKASEIITGKYGCNVIIKLGPHGSLINYDKNIEYFHPYEAKTIDTIGAGDCFNGAFAVMYMKSKNIEKSMEFANAAAAISTEGHGAFPSFPYLNTVLERMGSK